ncbi:hypothetical protein RCO48_24965 [Peribacillus frigoritolerans]|nr:hypothetical protein [Peribacillus frigoritolerans]
MKRTWEYVLSIIGVSIAAIFFNRDDHSGRLSQQYRFERNDGLLINDRF